MRRSCQVCIFGDEPDPGKDVCNECLKFIGKVGGMNSVYYPLQVGVYKLIAQSITISYYSQVADLFVDSPIRDRFLKMIERVGIPQIMKEVHPPSSS